VSGLYLTTQLDTLKNNSKMPEQLLQHAIFLTAQRDTDALDCALANTCKSLIPECTLMLFKIKQESDTLEPLYQRYELTSTNTDKICFVWQQDLKGSHVKEHFIQCVTSNEVLEYTDSGQHHMLIPVYADSSTNTLISITCTKSFEEKKTQLLQLFQIYKNNLNILHEGETDKLTGLFNRRTFDKKLEHLLLTQRKMQRSYSLDTNRTAYKDASTWLVIIDIDHFKQVNDQHGHVYGDEVLLRLSQIMSTTFRGSDLLFRFGGEEFVIILEPTPYDMAFKTLERFRHTVADFDFPLVGHISVSIGFSKIEVEDYPPEILDYADKALYYSKEHGRNSTNSYEHLIMNGLLSQASVSNETEIDLF